VKTFKDFKDAWEYAQSQANALRLDIAIEYSRASNCFSLNHHPQAGRGTLVRYQSSGQASSEQKTTDDPRLDLPFQVREHGNETPVDSFVTRDGAEWEAAKRNKGVGLRFGKLTRFYVWPLKPVESKPLSDPHGRCDHRETRHKASKPKTPVSSATRAPLSVNSKPHRSCEELGFPAPAAKLSPASARARWMKAYALCGCWLCEIAAGRYSVAEGLAEHARRHEHLEDSDICVWSTRGNYWAQAESRPLGLTDDHFVYEAARVIEVPEQPKPAEQDASPEVAA